MARFRAVTFDVTGTLLQFRFHPGEYYAKAGALFGVHVDPKTATKNLLGELKRMNGEHPNFGLHSGIGWERWWYQIVRQTFLKSSGTSHSEETLTKIYDHLVLMYQTTDCWDAQVGAYDLLERMSTIQVPVGIISNNDKRLETILKVMKMHKYFKFVLPSYDAGFVKPDPGIFRKAFGLFEIGDLKPKEVLHVGDKVDADYFGAENVGWNGSLVHVDNKEAILTKYPKVNRDRLFQNLKEIEEYIATNDSSKKN